MTKAADNEKHDLLHDVAYTVREEIANGLTHGLGILLGIIGLVVLVAYSVLYGDIWHVISSAIFGSSIIILYTASTLYHSVPVSRVKGLFRVLDHASIYILIAGTYTPLALVNMRDDYGWVVFGVIWALALAGVSFKLFLTGRFEKTSIAIYIGMGWMVVFAINPFLRNIDPGGAWLMLAGGLAYTLGIVFYAWKHLPYHHAVWHVFVLAGSVLHYFAILFYVIPGKPIA